MRLLHVTLLLCAVVALTSASCRKTCGAGWTLYHGRCYRYVATEMNWPDAENNCQSLCGNLVSISSAEEQNFVHSVVSSNSLSHLWLGGHDRVQEGHFLWSDGTKLTYTNWSHGEPNNGLVFGKQDCTQMYGKGSNAGKWDDVDCFGHKRASVCVKAF